MDHNNLYYSLESSGDIQLDSKYTSFNNNNNNNNNTEETDQPNCTERILLQLRTRKTDRRNVPDFGRVFLVLKCTDITQNTYIQS